MSELGQFLKTKREEQNISIEKMQEMTKIQKRYLAAIENGNYDALPGAFYTRAFVKSYAEALNLEPDDIFEAYGQELPKPKQQPTDLPSRTERARPRAKKKKQKAANVFPALMGILFVIVIAAGVYLVVQGTGSGSTGGASSPEENPSIEVDSNEDADTDEETRADENETDRPSEEEQTSEEEEAQEEMNEAAETDTESETPEFVSTENRRSTFDASTSDELVIELELTGDSYLDVKNRDGEHLDDLSNVSDGDTVQLDYSDEEYVILNIGNASVVTVSVNGEEIEYPLNPSEVVHQYLIFDKEE
ncbi:protein RodZ, contains Xre-like HTH and DUF4115 domains [Alteribacillus persepolensis]|uniref:Protein RodZ, contains Xre-like HTH and DUF4115 domains n=1 Tax=Alteribacillus persepolensis TaxID=568899 RepID=A0A1G7YUM4_9BACI|nr:helix-turn-helix domain-containing protein [Alteribacillus persepolensis]SDH00045.1 protein RodZ, contains Xre-like HTH and DUF4115 domains [Alteribacillus persepolensis]